MNKAAVVDLKADPKEGKTRALNKLLFHPSFRKTVDELGKLGLALPPAQQNVSLQLETYQFPQNGELHTSQKEIEAVSLDATSGQNACSEFQIAAYDESVNKYTSLEGSAFLISYSLVLVGKDEYIPVNLLSLDFYTKCSAFAERYSHITLCQDIDVESNRKFAQDKIKFLDEYVPPKSLLLIDGPLIGGNITAYTLKTVERLLAKDIIPIFFVKNSESSLVRDSIPELRRNYNSDLHWSFEFLKTGQRTSFIPYVDAYNPNNAKFFCYVKAYDASPQRVELDKKTYEKYKNVLPKIMDLIYYLLLVQGDKKNPQVRPIAIAEKFARETIHLINLGDVVQSAGLTPTMNQERFAW